MSKQEQKELELSQSERTIYGFFDIDDTLTKGNITVSFARFLAECGFISDEDWSKIYSNIEAYGQSDRGESAYFIFATDILNNFAESLKGKSVDSVKEKAREFFDSVLRGDVNGYKIHSFSKDLVSKIKGIGRAVAISGSPEEILGPINDYLGFDEIEATIFEKADGHFTGMVKRNLAIDSEKEKVVSRYLDDVDSARSFAFGDSTHDIPLLKCVGNSYVLGNNPALQKVGREEGWHINENGDGVLEAVSQ